MKKEKINGNMLGTRGCRIWCVCVGGGGVYFVPPTNYLGLCMLHALERWPTAVNLMVNQSGWYVMTQWDFEKSNIGHNWCPRGLHLLVNHLTTTTILETIFAGESETV